MTPKEAYESLCYEIYEEGHCSYMEEELDIAIKALEKQIPKKPINQSEEYDRTYGNCPCCGEMVVDYPDDFIVCSNCGQRLDWSDDE